jgi:hypothetical protein
MEDNGHKLYEVEINYRVFVVAKSSKDAEYWAEDHPSEWSQDPHDGIHALVVDATRGKSLPEDSQLSLPWCARSVSRVEAEQNIRWWVDKAERTSASL